jgi:uncharacterized membrane protein
MASTMTQTPVLPHHPTTRLEAFSDGVFAIGITLLVFNLPVPKDAGDGTTLLAALAAQGAEFAAFVVSFAVIGIMWVNHHNLFRLITRTDHILLVLNMLLLFGVTFVPYPTRIMAAYIGKPDSLTASVFYGLIMWLMSVFFHLIWSYTIRHRHLLVESVTDAQIRDLSRAYNIGFVIYTVALIVSFFSAELNLLLNFLLAVFFALPLQRNRFDGD